MPRPPRILLAGVPLHIVQRGHNRKPCFFAPHDREAYLHRLRIALDTADVALHAYCLMTNHVHLLITPSAVAAVPELMMSLGRRYVQYINRRYGRTGTLWDSRYKSSLIEAETYLFACHRYIEMNPVRAGLVDDPAAYRWSSYRSNALGRYDHLVTPRLEYVALGDCELERKDAYKELFQRGLDDPSTREIRDAIDRGRALGSSEFRSMVEPDFRPGSEPRPRGRPRKQPMSSVASGHAIAVDTMARTA